MQVQFVYADWIASYPQFSATVTTAPQALGYFNTACLYCSNNDGNASGGPGYPLGYSGVPLIPYDTTVSPPITDRLQILWLLTAHIAQLTVGCVIAGVIVPPGPLVGRVNSATQGSVSVQADVGNVPMGAAWFYQTQFGMTAWGAMAPYRTARYRANPGRFAQIPGGAWPGGIAPFGSPFGGPPSGYGGWNA